MSITAYTDVKVCNIAVGMLGEFPITSIAQPETDTEATCALLYPSVVSYLLSAHDWAFANPVRQLAVDADQPPLYGYDYAYKLPSDLIAGPFSVYGDGDTASPITDYKLANGYVYSSLNRIDVAYRSQPDPSEWPGYFVTLVATALAADLAIPVMEDKERASELRIRAYGSAQENGLGGLFRQARNIDAKSKPIKSIFRNGNYLLNTRY